MTITDQTHWLCPIDLLAIYCIYDTFLLSVFLFDSSQRYLHALEEQQNYIDFTWNVIIPLSLYIHSHVYLCLLLGEFDR